MVAKKTSGAAQKQTRSQQVKKKLSEPTTWAGLLTVAAAIASGGASVLADPAMLAQVASGIALVFAREGG